MFDDTLIEHYRTYLTEERKSPVNTIKAYMHDLTRFTEFLTENDKAGFSDVTEDDVQAFISHLTDIGLSTATISRCIASLKTFHNRMFAQGLLQSDPTTDIAAVRAKKTPPLILSGGEIERLLEQPDIRDVKGSRDRAMLETLYATGIRVSELIALDESDVNLATGLIACRNGKDRIIPIYDAAVKAISHYMAFGRPKMAVKGEKALFVNIGGGRMSRQGCWKILKGYAVDARIKIDMTPQILRNSFAAHLLENGADLQSLQEMLGHADISSTQVYAKAVNKKIKDIYYKSHPKA